MSEGDTLDEELRALGRYLDSRPVDTGTALVTMARAMGASVRSLARTDEDRRALLERLAVVTETHAGLADKPN
ncbi:hypothetical protein [Sediminicurvatus halobius]|uniref:Uncharacterized protein n=1 Tax=Sediminicurvatus halobius TaxID=2182432 RepID=A0A2U2N033_9GAMM|nr:hypothetical protein [Spiribacter halobius]PWG62324.1 hypothetical protein DEM34_12685 [Spiribacter halobius]UEX79754.1 hypothetical protein LMH63_08940 [Spiribacter halobius]